MSKIFVNPKFHLFDIQILPEIRHHRFQDSPYGCHDILLHHRNLLYFVISTSSRVSNGKKIKYWLSFDDFVTSRNNVQNSTVNGHLLNFQLLNVVTMLLIFNFIILRKYIFSRVFNEKRKRRKKFVSPFFEKINTGQY